MQYSDVSVHNTNSHFEVRNFAKQVACYRIYYYFLHLIHAYPRTLATLLKTHRVKSGHRTRTQGYNIPSLYQKFYCAKFSILFSHLYVDINDCINQYVCKYKKGNVFPAQGIKALVKCRYSSNHSEHCH
jgi:hypothetical protein